MVANLGRLVRLRLRPAACDSLAAQRRLLNNAGGIAGIECGIAVPQPPGLCTSRGEISAKSRANVESRLGAQIVC